MHEVELEQLELLVTRQIDGRITPEEQLELDEMIARDPQAAAMAERLFQDDFAVRSGLRMVSRGGPIEQPDAVMPPEMPLEASPAEAGAEPKQPSRMAAWRGWLGVAAAFVLVAFGTFGVLTTARNAAAPHAPPMPGPQAIRPDAAAPQGQADSGELPRVIERTEMVSQSGGQGAQSAAPLPRYIAVRRGDSIYLIEVPAEPATSPVAF